MRADTLVLHNGMPNCEFLLAVVGLPRIAVSRRGGFVAQSIWRSGLATLDWRVHGADGGGSQMQRAGDPFGIANPLFLAPADGCVTSGRLPRRWLGCLGVSSQSTAIKTFPCVLPTSCHLYVFVAALAGSIVGMAISWHRGRYPLHGRIIGLHGRLRTGDEAGLRGI